MYIVADAVEHQNFPIDLLFDQLRKKTYKRQIPPCTATVVMLEIFMTSGIWTRLLTGCCSISVREDTGIRGTVHFDPDRYTEPAVKRIISHFTHLLGQAPLQVGADIRESAFSRSRSAPKSCWSLTASAAISPPDAAVSQSSKSRYRRRRTP
ncbi:hypothetical protein [Paenibacillus larvae]|uniref:hypothetical protein n=1 Tax=Paenibacillus larvae TaxID=1464 RepID=UPI00288E831C|nr:hypothetical protein [Paenibacillus larvae]MDT2194455.1 hypothetical protein [Paenibacillus larvae]